MNRLHRLSAAVVCVGFAAACGGNNRETTAEHENTTAATNAQSESDKPTGESESLSVTGCLTSADGRYVLTELAGGIESPAGSTTEAYQLTNADQKLRPHIGKQVRVNGTIKETSELHKEATKTNTGGDRRLDIDAGDLAKIDVQGIVQVAEECGQK